MFNPRVSVIQGASKGIGFAFARDLLNRSPNHHVIATCREPHADLSGLPKLLKEFPKQLTVIACDIWKEEDIQNAAGKVKEKYKKIDFLLNSSGILNLEQKGETNLSQVHADSVLAAYKTNALGPLLMGKHFSSLLHHTRVEKGMYTGVIANISARVGSIGDNKQGGWYAYRASKAAQNMITKTMSIELYAKQVLCVGLHPGTVNTSFSERYHKNVKHNINEPDEVVNYFCNVIGGLKMDDSGKYLDFNGKEIPW